MAALPHTRAAAQELLRQKLARTAQAIRNDALLAAPVDTGRLRQSITVQEIAEDHYRVGTNVDYAPHVEFGTRNTAPQPFLRPALEKARRG